MECLDDERADGGVALCSFVPVAEMDNPARLQTFSVTVLTSYSKHSLIDKDCSYIQAQPRANDRWL